MRFRWPEPVLAAVSVLAPWERAPVLLLGSPGAGKSTLAEDLHRVGRRAAGPFVHVNCGAIPSNLFTARLFGTRRGAFTGAEDHHGLIHEARGGTLFLDEIGELSQEVQVALNVFLDRGTSRPVGGREDRPADVRLILATWRDPAEALRPDLWDRLSPNVIRLPAPTPEIVRDALADWVNAFAAAHDVPGLRLSSVLVEELVLEAAAARSFRGVRGRALRAFMVARSVGATEVGPEHDHGSAPREGDSLRGTIEHVAVTRCLREADGDVLEAARRAGVGRSTFYSWMKRHGIRAERRTGRT